jgi:rRNA maturation endonuclease Nob1
VTACLACATELQQNAKFCFECGAPVASALAVTRAAAPRQPLRVEDERRP